MTSYSVGDIPTIPLVLEPSHDGAALDLSDYDTAFVEFYDPDGVLVDPAEFVATIDAGTDTVIVDWPAESVLAVPGIHQLIVTLDGPEARRTLPAERIVAEAVNSGWYTLATARQDWPDAPDDDAQLADYLAVAKRDVLVYAPTLPDASRPPVAYPKAQLMQARNSWNADKGDAGNGEFGMGPFAATPRPLDWAIRQTLRPKTPRPTIG